VGAGGLGRPDAVVRQPEVSVVTAGANTYVTDWTGLGAVDPVSAVMMHNNVYNEFVLETVTRSRTDWVATMPTKRFYIANGSGNNAGRLFQRNFNGNSGSCDDVAVSIYDRKSARSRRRAHSRRRRRPRPTRSAGKPTSSRSTTRTCSARRPRQRPDELLGGLAGLNFLTATVPTGKHQLVGGASTVFNTAAGTTSALTSTTFSGLPVIGFAAITFENGTLTDGAGKLIQSQYGGSFNHKQTRSIQ